MKNKALLEEIAKDTSIIDSHIKRLNKKPDEVHEIDIELISDKLKEIYSRVLELETGIIVKEEIQLDKPEPVPVPEKEEEPALPEIKQEEQSPLEEINEEEMDTEPEPIAEEKPEPHIEEPVAETKTTADLFSGPTTIADSFQVEEDKSIAAIAAPLPVQDLKMAIGINDKFLFINELFKGSPADYNEAIDKFNASGGIPEAETSINAYREQFDWADNSEAYHRLKKIVFSKYNGQ